MQNTAIGNQPNLPNLCFFLIHVSHTLYQIVSHECTAYSIIAYKRFNGISVAIFIFMWNINQQKSQNVRSNLGSKCLYVEIDETSHISQFIHHFIAKWPPHFGVMFFILNSYILKTISQIAKFMGPTRGPPWSRRPKMGPMLVPWNLLSRILSTSLIHKKSRPLT